MTDRGQIQPEPLPRSAAGGERPAGVWRYEAELETILRDVPASICLTRGPDHVIEMANPAYELAVGASRTFLGRSIREAFPELRESGLFELYDRVYHSGEAWSGNEVLIRMDRRGDGRLEDVWFDVTCQPVRNGSGEVSGILTFAVEVTAQVLARERLEEQSLELARQNAELRIGEEQFRTMAESIPQLAWIAHRDGHIFWYNQRWYDYTGTTPEQMEGWGWQSVHHPDRLPRVLERWRASIETGEPFDMEFPLRGADGEFRWFLTRVQPVRDENGVVQRWFGTNTDVDERHRTEHFLEEARREAEAANRAKSGFLAHMSHELRTPINAIMGYAQLLELEVSGPLTDTQAKQIDRILGSSRHLLALVNDILDLTRIEAGAMVIARTTVDVRAIVAEAVELVLPAAAAREVRLVGPDEDAPALEAIGDADRTRQILANLIGNAVKFSAGGDAVRVRIAPASATDAPPGLEAEGPSLRVDVVDDGIGIGGDDLERIFEPFFQVDSGLTRSGVGTGLGLTISRRLARAMGGELTVESHPGDGSTFTLWLPAAQGV